MSLARTPLCPKSTRPPAITTTACLPVSHHRPIASNNTLDGRPSASGHLIRATSHTQQSYTAIHHQHSIRLSKQASKKASKLRHRGARTQYTYTLHCIPSAGSLAVRSSHATSVSPANLLCQAILRLRNYICISASLSCVCFTPKHHLRAPPIYKKRPPRRSLCTSRNNSQIIVQR